MALVITTCTNRKRKEIPQSLYFCALRPSKVDALALDWARRLTREPVRYRAADIYGGRSFREASAAAEALSAPLLIVSAGLGLIGASSQVPPYACTVLPGAPDSVASRIDGKFTGSDWWRALVKVSPFGVNLAAMAHLHDGPILAALSDAYLAMVADELLDLPRETLARVRIFTRTPIDRVNPRLQHLVLPYDDRLNGPDSPLPGTLSDFSGRALRHFVDHIYEPHDGRAVREHAAEVSACLANWRFPQKITRARLEDVEILALLRKHWRDEGGMTLRRLRHEFNVRCEQSRFALLARMVRREHE